VRRHEVVKEPQARNELVRSVSEMAEICRTMGDRSAAEYLEILRARRIQSVDPSEIDWNVFRLFDIEYAEVRWTQWLASTMRPENGPALAALTWMAFCEAVCLAIVGLSPEERASLSELASIQDWKKTTQDSTSMRTVEDEAFEGELGRIDIVVETQTLVAVIENKIRAGWHDAEDRERQAVRYRKAGRRRVLGTTRRLGLVVLTNRDDFVLDPEDRDFVLVRYRDLGRILRRHLKKTLRNTASAEELLGLWPALLTLKSIEEDLLGLPTQVLRKKPEDVGWRNLPDLRELMQYSGED